MATDVVRGGAARGSALNDPKVRGIVFQVVFLVLLLAAIYWIVGNTIDNLRRSNIASGFGFLGGRAGFDISESWIVYNSDRTYGRALIVGLLNTVYVALLGIVTATILGFIIGVARLSGNWLIRKIATVYVEVFRNIPPLLVIFFWYFGVLSVLPLPRDSIQIGIPLAYHIEDGRVIGLPSLWSWAPDFWSWGAYLNSRGLYFPRAVWDGAFLPGLNWPSLTSFPSLDWAPVVNGRLWIIDLALLIAIAMVVFVVRRARQRQAETGQQFPVFWTSAALLVGLPLLAFFAAGMPLSFDLPKQSTFNLTGGSVIKPEFLSLYLALSFYTASFIAEIVRAGIVGVSRGQTEASRSLGLSPGQTLRLVVIPQAMRIIIPPLTSQYLNLTKNSSLAIAIGFPDLVAIGGTILNQTGQAIEVVAIWMAIYLGLSLLTSAFMNWFNAKMALVER